MNKLSIEERFELRIQYNGIQHQLSERGLLEARRLELTEQSGKIYQIIIENDTPIIRTHQWIPANQSTFPYLIDHSGSSPSHPFICVKCKMTGQSFIKGDMPTMLLMPYLTCGEMILKDILE